MNVKDVLGSTGNVYHVELRPSGNSCSCHLAGYQRVSETVSVGLRKTGQDVPCSMHLLSLAVSATAVCL